MPRLTTWVCDRCGSKHERPDQLWTIGLRYASGDMDFQYHSGMNITNSERKLLCRPCMAACGIFDPKRGEEPPPAPPPTFEELFREFIWNVAQEVVDANK